MQIRRLHRPAGRAGGAVSGDGEPADPGDVRLASHSAVALRGAGEAVARFGPPTSVRRAASAASPRPIWQCCCFTSMIGYGPPPVDGTGREGWVLRRECRSATWWTFGSCRAMVRWGSRVNSARRSPNGSGTRQEADCPVRSAVERSVRGNKVRRLRKMVRLN